MHRVEKIVDDFIQTRRPQPSERNKIDLGFRLEDQSIVISETRADMEYILVLTRLEMASL